MYCCGNLGIGTTTPSNILDIYGTAPDIASGAGEGIFPTLTSTAHNQYGLNVSPTINPPTGASSQIYGGMLAQPLIYNNNDLQTSGLIVGISGTPSVTGTSNVQNVYGGYFQDLLGNTASTTNTIGAYIGNPYNISGAARTTNNYGLFIGSQTAGSSTNFAVYSQGGANYFGGNVGIGAVSQSATLQLGGSNANLYVNTTHNPTPVNPAPIIGAVATSSSTVISLVGNGINEIANLWQPVTGGAGMMSFYTGTSQTSVGSIVSTGSATAYNTSSDRRIKENIATTTLGLAQLMEIPVRSFDFINDPTHATTTGFIAQELNQVFPWAVTTNGDDGIVPLSPTSTPWSVDYGRVTPLIVKAVQDIADISSTFKSNLIAWLGDSGNGIGDFFARNVYAQNVTGDTVTAKKTLCVDESNGTPVCVTGDQLAAIMAIINQGSSTSTASTSTGSAPVIAVNGNNPATIDIGATYNDLGATITGPTADLNLGISASVDGATSTPISSIHIDTSVAGVHVITYSATDQGGLTGTATRTVDVVDPSTATTTTSTVSTSSPQASATTATTSTSTSTSTSTTTATSTTTTSTTISATTSTSSPQTSTATSTTP